MESDIFRAGVRPGAPNTEVEVKMLLCYTLWRLGQPISFDQLYRGLSEHSLVNYFELTYVLEKLQASGHLSTGEQTPAAYTTTSLGNEAGKEFEKNLPLTVREKALDACARAIAQDKRLAQVQITKTPRQGGGFTMEFALPSEAGQLLCVQVYAPTNQECERMRRNFLNAPLSVYKGMVALLTGDEQVLGQVFTWEKPLF